MLIGFLEFLLIAILIYTSFLLQLLIKFLQQYHVPQQFELLLENKAVLIVCILIFLLILSYVLLYLMLRGLLYSIYANARYIGVVTIGLSLSLLNGVWLGYALLHSSELTAFLLIAIVSISFLIFAIYLLYRYYVLPVIILSVGVYAFAAGFTLITYSISYAAAASPPS
ncbi:hypothetical protein [Vulcanisaeta distributa]|uniref:hypothetical protein n=1 Tax=Vulcanisaeta distributa TaxID=164451 RepID=UPI0006CFEAC3|nr:hypothetical protein [Vulcanisaeta distributa]